MPVVRVGMLITLTRRFLFYSLFNVLAGVSSSVIQTPDNTLKHQRIQAFFWSGVPCFLPPRTRLLLLEGKLWQKQRPWGFASSAQRRLCTSALPSAAPRPGLASERSVSCRPGFEKALQQKKLSSGISAVVLLLLRFWNSMLSALDVNCFLQVFCSLRPVLCLYAGEELSETVLAVSRTVQRRKNKPNSCVKIGQGEV